MKGDPRSLAGATRRHVVQAIAGGCIFGYSSSRASSADEARSSVLGLHDPLSPASALLFGASAIRTIVHVENIDSRLTSIIDQLRAYKLVGTSVIVTLAGWNGAKGAALPEEGSLNWRNNVDRFIAFARAAGSLVDVVCLDNEPMYDLAPSDLPNGSDRYPRVPALRWYTTLASLARGVFKGHSSRRPVVSAPAVNDVEFVARGDPASAAVVGALVDWADKDPNVEWLDVHLHVSSAQDIVDALNYMDARSRKPKIVTEWSQAGAVRHWLDDLVDPGFAAQWNVSPLLTNRAWVQACYSSPVARIMWDAFVATAPYDARFMGDAWAALAAGGVRFGTYGAGIQYGDATFDTKQLLANLTVVPGAQQQPQENYRFGSWYRALAAAIRAGLVK